MPHRSAASRTRSRRAPRGRAGPARLSRPSRPRLDAGLVLILTAAFMVVLDRSIPGVNAEFPKRTTPVSDQADGHTRAA